MGDKHYVVTGEMVAVKTETTNGPMVVNLYKDAPVPRDASKAWLDHHLESGLIEEVPAGEPAAESPPAPAGPHPAGAAEQPRGATAQSKAKG